MTPAGIEPASSESESEILSIVLRSQFTFQISSASCRLKILFSFDCFRSRLELLVIYQIKGNVALYRFCLPSVVLFQSFFQILTMAFIQELKIAAFNNINKKHTLKFYPCPTGVSQACPTEISGRALYYRARYNQLQK